MKADAFVKYYSPTNEKDSGHHELSTHEIKTYSEGKR